ncbi:MAG: D-alanine--D-alanine ligase family protein [Eggerthellaceae bacterium]|jgi:D-alanine-D-alanine ligase
MKVAVLMGGAAATRERSLRSGKNVCKALAASGHTVLPLDTTVNLTTILCNEHPDIVFNALYGYEAECGAVQELLEFLDIPFVGASSSVCRDACNRGALPSVLEGYQGALGGSMTAAWPHGIVLSRMAVQDMGAYSALNLVADRIPGGYPLCVKSVHGMPGFAAYRVEDHDELAGALIQVLAVDDSVVIQQWVEGINLSAFVLGSGYEALVLPPVEIDQQDGELYTPVRLESLAQDQENAQAIRSEIERAAMEAYLAFGIRDIGRVDLIWDGAQARILRVRTVVDYSADSPFHQALAAASLTFEGVANALVGGLSPEE